MSVHTMEASLDESARYADAPWWEEVYRKAFPSYQGMLSVRDDGPGQRTGIDRHVGLANGRTITVDEKVRTQDWDDFALEYYSDYARRDPGWIAKDLACDYIAYAFVPSGRCYLLPFPQLREAWRRHHKVWVDKYRKPSHYAISTASGRQWETRFVPVPIREVLGAITDAMLVTFDEEFFQ